MIRGSPALLLAAALVVAGCGDPEAPQRPLGTFLLDVNEMAAVLEAQGVPKAEARANAAAGRARLVFDPKGSFTLVLRPANGKPERWRGTWERDAGGVTFRTTVRDGKAVDPPQVVRGELDGGRLRIQPGGEGTTPLILRPE